MLIENIMNTDVVTLSPEDTLETAIRLIKEKRIRHIPIVLNGHLDGIISDRDVKDCSPSILHKEHEEYVLHTKIKEIMKHNVITAHPRDFVEEAAGMMAEHKIGCLPVISNNKLVGIVTESDLLHRLVELLGVHQPSSHIEVEVPDKAGMLADVATLFKNHHINVTSVLVNPGANAGTKHLVFRVQAMDTRHVTEEIRQLGYKVLTP